MAEIRHRIGVQAPQPQVGELLGELDGLRRWWTTTTSGDASAGGRLQFFFGGSEPGAVMEVTASGENRIAWRCVDGPEDWIDTTVEFELSHSDGETVLLFTHGNWREPTAFMAHCATKWGYFLLGLKASLEGGVATPYPGELKMSSWG